MGGTTVWLICSAGSISAISSFTGGAGWELSEMIVATGAGGIGVFFTFRTGSVEEGSSEDEENRNTTKTNAAMTHAGIDKIKNVCEKKRNRLFFAEAGVAQCGQVSA